MEIGQTASTTSQQKTANRVPCLPFFLVLFSGDPCLTCLMKIWDRRSCKPCPMPTILFDENFGITNTLFQVLDAQPERNYLEINSPRPFARRAPVLFTEMGSPPRPHAVLIPQPAQGHVTPMLQLAKVLHSKGFHITYVNSEYNHKRLVRSRGSDSLSGLEDFRFEAIPDGLLPSDNDDVTQDIAELCISTTKNSLVPFRDLLIRLNNSPGVPMVSCVIADGVMSFAQRVAEKMGILSLVFWTTSACGFMGYLHFSELIRRGYTPLKGKLAANPFLIY